MTTETKKTEETKAAPPTVELYQHKNNAVNVGPTTGKPLADWRKTRDYENFNPTVEK